MFGTPLTPYDSKCQKSAKLIFIKCVEIRNLEIFQYLPEFWSIAFLNVMAIYIKTYDQKTTSQMYIGSTIDFTDFDEFDEFGDFGDFDDSDDIDDIAKFDEFGDIDDLTHFHCTLSQFSRTSRQLVLMRKHLSQLNGSLSNEPRNGSEW